MKRPTGPLEALRVLSTPDPERCMPLTMQDGRRVLEYVAELETALRDAEAALARRWRPVVDAPRGARRVLVRYLSNPAAPLVAQNYAGVWAVEGRTIRAPDEWMEIPR